MLLLLLWVRLWVRLMWRRLACWLPRLSVPGRRSGQLRNWPACLDARWLPGQHEPSGWWVLLLLWRWRQPAVAGW